MLAFEPTFVEVRHVETGDMVQVIQGNNLRCVFAEAPPSATHSSAIPGAFHQQPPPPYNPHDPRYSPYGGVVGDRSSVYSTASSSTLYHNSRPPLTPRNDIIMVSDDRVMSLQLVVPSSPPDSSSQQSHTLVHQPVNIRR